MTRLYSLEVHTSPVQIALPDVTLEGLLGIPDGARSIIVFAQGRGSSRNNAIDTFLATEYQHAGLATLLLDLYTPAELEEDSFDAHLRFRTDMLGQRLTAVTDWMIHNTTTHPMSIGLMAASTGGAAAIIAAAARPEAINSLACRAARPDLARNALQYIHTPCLFIVGANDPLVAELNDAALAQMPPVGKLLQMPGVGHDFTEGGALEHLAFITVDFFTQHLPLNRAI